MLMKNLLFAAFSLLAISSMQLRAQTPDGGGAPPPSPMDALTADEKTHLNTDYQKSVANNAKLRQEEAEIRTDVEGLQKSHGTSMPKEQFIKKMKGYRTDLEADMLKNDPSLQPVLTKLHAAEAKMGVGNT